MNDLNPKQKRFAEEYVLDLDATQAYIRAGYKPKSPAVAAAAAARLLTDVNVARYVTELQAQRSRRTEIESDQVLQEIAIVAFSRITDFLVIENDTVSLTPQQTWGEKERAIARASQGKYGISLELHDKLSALKLLMDHLGMNSEFNRSIQGLRKYGLEIFRDDRGRWQIRDLNAAELEN